MDRSAIHDLTLRARHYLTAETRELLEGVYGLHETGRFEPVEHLLAVQTLDEVRATRQQLERFGFDVEVLFIARRLGYSVIEVPVRWNDVAGTKVSALNGFAAFLDPLRVRFNQWKGKYR